MMKSEVSKPFFRPILLLSISTHEDNSKPLEWKPVHLNISGQKVGFGKCITQRNKR